MLESSTRITLEEAALFAGVSLRAIRRAARQHQLEYVLTGSLGHVCTTPGWVESWRHQRTHRRDFR